MHSRNEDSSAKIDPRSINRIVCIMSYQSSASCLMTSLLDNHPNVLSTPDDVLAEFSDFWEENKNLHLNEMIDKFLFYYAMLFDARIKNLGNVYSGKVLGFTNLGKNRDEFLYVNKDEFKRCMCEYMRNDKYPLSRKFFFQSMHLAYSKALGREVTNPIIVFGLHNTNSPDRLKALLEDFSDIEFLQMVRNPIRVVASRFRWQNRLGIDVLRGFGRAAINAGKGGAVDPSTPLDKWRAIRMEDLHGSPEKTLKKICHWLDLPWNENLLKSTVNGKKWWNLSGGIQVSGFSTAIASQAFEDYLPSFDRFRLSVLLVRKCNSWKYALPRWHKSLIAKIIVFPLLLIPFKMELMSWPSLKKNFKKNNDMSIFKRVFLCSWEVCSGFGRVRIAMVQVWLLAFKRNSKEAQLL